MVESNNTKVIYKNDDSSGCLLVIILLCLVSVCNSVSRIESRLQRVDYDLSTIEHKINMLPSK